MDDDKFIKRCAENQDISPEAVRDMRGRDRWAYEPTAESVTALMSAVPNMEHQMARSVLIGHAQAAAGMVMELDLSESAPA